MKLKQLYYTSLLYVILGLISGVFYREYTKWSEFDGQTLLKGVHTHILVLGFLFFLIVLILGKLFAVHEARSFKAWYYVYNLGLLFTISTMVARGIGQVNDLTLNGLSHAAGLGHTILGAGLIWLLILLGKRIKQ
ncbi:DUF2871 domain-containing protein [Paenibacillus sp. ACRRX]|uniref:DUF2871 domain-containing protein n=1 Tax=unclassified Paenibacillus TaxID=185978 RepID=UPI001EF5023C|nr:MULTISPECIES: DUF2871 domain-containing protein [unclassified Paenibacillus]MCG7410503.1 DUF2871 domain-containing protein [Paenibacillus sp. ACRRX]MDK8183927.1 DUF2871 domain-containing protein [Paenibacillus sp. UMB4589-SE434]